jgi:hypothetical protein
MRNWLGVTRTGEKHRHSWVLAGLAALVGMVALCAAVVATMPGTNQEETRSSLRVDPLLDLENAGTPAVHEDLLMWFEPNRGQASEVVAFQFRGLGYAVQLTHSAVATLILPGNDLLRMDLVDANSRTLAAGQNPLVGVSNYLIGSDPDGWQTGIPHFRRVSFEDVYPGISLTFYGSRGQLEYDFVVAPSADPSKIRVGFECPGRLAISPSGDLVFATENGRLVQRAPVLFQEIDGIRHEVEGSFRLLSQSPHRSEVGFALGQYDPSHPLTIDPRIDYSTFLGGGSGDLGRDVALDSSGNVYVTGMTFSSDFPTQSPEDGSRGGSSDAFVAKFDPTGTTLVYSTYLGGSGSEQALGIAIDPSGNAYVAGETSSTDFPTASAYQDAYGGAFHDCFIVKLNAAGSAFVFSTYWGGNGDDYGTGIDVDIHGNPYVTGRTYSSNFPTKSAFQGTKGGFSGQDAFVSKFNDIGTFVYYSTYLGGTTADSAADIVVDSYYQAYVVGATESTDFPTAAAVQDTRAGQFDAFIAKLSSSGAKLFATYYGGSSFDSASTVTVGPSDRPYFAGYTESANFPTTGAYQSTLSGGKDAFVAKFTSSGTPTYSTYFGGGGDDQVGGIAVDQARRSHVVGWTTSTDFPLIDPLQILPGGGNDAFSLLLDATGGPMFFTYLGGVGHDYAEGIVLDDSYDAFITGWTYSTDFPTRGALQPTNAGERDLFLTKIDNSYLDFFTAGVPDTWLPAPAAEAAPAPPRSAAPAEPADVVVLRDLQ